VDDDTMRIEDIGRMCLVTDADLGKNKAEILIEKAT
jgi:molybdopterin/thiamine biosynthesis adenylyltransferase